MWPPRVEFCGRIVIFMMMLLYTVFICLLAGIVAGLGTGLPA